MRTMLFLGTLSIAFVNLISADYCGPQYFNPATHFCMFNKVGKYCDPANPVKYSPWQEQCCGTLRYKIWESHCENGQIKPGTDDDKCNGLPFNKATHFCYLSAVAPYCNLNNKVQYNPYQQACCFTSLYNIWSQDCINGVVKNKVWSDATQNHDESDVRSTLAYCGSEAYNPDYEFCLYNKIGKYCDPQNKVTYSPWSFKCCGIQMYNIWNSRCQNGQVRPGAEGSENTCNGESYDPNTHFCESNKLAPYCNPRSKITYNPWSYACCGTTTYNIWSHDCISGIPKPKNWG